MKTFTCFLAVAFLSATNLHAQTTASRLVAYAAYINFYVSDSEYYTYTGSNGGDLTHLLNYTNGTLYSYNPNPGIDSFVTYSAAQETFNANGTKSDSLTQYWDTTHWKNEWRTLFNYDANNRDTFMNNQQWNGTNWVGNERTFYHYTNNYIDTATYVDTFYSGGWVNNTKISYAYNASGYKTDEVIEYWDPVKNRWQNIDNVQFIYYYNSFNNDTATVSQVYDTTGAGKWVNYYKLLNTFDVHHNIINQVELVWDTTAIDTASKNKFFYKYDANGNDTSDVTLQYNGNISMWDTVMKNSYTYNSFNQVTYHKSYNAFSFEPYNEIKYYYQDYTAGVEQLAVDNGQLTVYPNPASDCIYVSIQLNQPSYLQLRLVNMLGQTVWVTDAGTVNNYQNNISVGNLPDGVYLLEMLTGGGTESQKIIVAR